MFEQIGDLTVAEGLATSAARTFGVANRREGVLVDLHVAQLHLQAADPGAPSLARCAIDNVAQLRTTRAREQLGPLADALDDRRDGESRQLAEHARRVATTPRAS